NNSWNRISAALSSSVCEAGKRNPRQSRVVNHVITQGRFQRSASDSNIVHCFAHISEELFEVALVIKIRVGEALIRKQHRGSTVYDVVDQHLFIFEAVAERLDFICDPKSKIMEGQRNLIVLLVHERFEISNIDLSAQVVVWFRVLKYRFISNQPRR